MLSLTKRQMAIVRCTRAGHRAEQQALMSAAVKTLFFIPVFLLFLTGPAYGDRGPVIWQEGVKLSQESQKAIILHNSREEVLILGTELRASKEMQVLEFIPFPSEPKVSLARGAPFKEIAKLIREKGLLFQYESLTKGGQGGKTAPVEIRLSEKIGLHDVTTVKINDIGQFSRWLEDFFRSKGIHADKEKLSRVYSNARDYVQRGINYFVFDRVSVSKDVKFIAPLVYRFRSDRIYYPLKTSNLIGGKGVVDLIFVLPGSLTDEIWKEMDKIIVRGNRLPVFGPDVMISSSSKVYPREVQAIYGPEPFFGKAAKIYIQVLRYSGPYNFRDDFIYDIAKLVPYAHKFREEARSEWWLHQLPRSEEETEFTPPFTADEKRDLREALCPESDTKKSFLEQNYGLHCRNFIPNEEYKVYAALFKKRELAGIPWGRVVLEDTTVRKGYKGANIDPVLQKAFNDKNRVSYPLEHAFPQSDTVKIWIRGDADAAPLKGRTYISRAGFSKDRTRALVYVEHIKGPGQGVGYYVTLEKRGGEWQITSSVLAPRDELHDHVHPREPGKILIEDPLASLSAKGKILKSSF